METFKELHSTPSRNFHSHTDFERSPYRSVADSSRYYQGSSEHPRDRMENSKENLVCNRKEVDHSMDRNGSYRNCSEYPKDTVKSFRNIKGYSNDRMRLIRDRNSYRNQSSPRERMTFPRNKPRSFRETTDLSWDEMGFSQRESILGLTLGILECTMVGHGCIHKIHHLVCSHNRDAHILYQCQHHLVYKNGVLLVLICGRIRVKCSRR